MPDHYKHNYSSQGFECIHTQDVPPLLVECFDFELFVPFANLIMAFIGRPFGPNFDPNRSEDLAFIDHIHELDEKHMAAGNIKPTQMLAVMYKQSMTQNQPINTQSNPKEDIRFPTN